MKKVRRRREKRRKRRRPPWQKSTLMNVHLEERPPSWFKDHPRFKTIYSETSLFTFKIQVFLSQILPCKYLPWPTSILFYDQLGLTSIKVDWEERFHCTHEHCRHVGRKLIGDDGKTGCDERGGSQGFHGTHQEAHHDEYGARRTFTQGPVSRNIYWFSERTALWLSQLHLKRNFPIKTNFYCIVLLTQIHSQELFMANTGHSWFKQFLLMKAYQHTRTQYFVGSIKQVNLYDSGHS